ncbi:MAG TPA: hypothetical protein G4O05_09830 [Caldilineae bacterium]|nr:hypothetical protein [Caldilineae bacterium]
MKEAVIARCNAILAVTENDSTNSFIDQIARELFRIPKVMAQVFDPARASICESLGIEVIRPAILGGATLLICRSFPSSPHGQPSPHGVAGGPSSGGRCEYMFITNLPPITVATCGTTSNHRLIIQRPRR